MADWKYELEEVGPDGVQESADEIERESPDLENVVFFVLGVALAVGLVATAI